jgi:hypothetical protein
MAFTQYKTVNFRPQRLAMIEQANAICEEYAAQGLVLTLRQLYYQFVARGLLENKQTEYKRLGELCADARMAGKMDWDHLIDRTRNITAWRTYKDPQQALKRTAEQYARDLWEPQFKRVEVWIEKDAAIGVVENVCRDNSVPYFSCRGYTSLSEMHEAAQRIRDHVEDGHQVQILHIGDHDPSGLDMTRDIEDRLRGFISRDWAGLHMGPGQHTRGAIRRSMLQHMAGKGNHAAISGFTVPWGIKRIGLNLDQIERYNPPPNPVKTTDARFLAYQAETGLNESWELDALDPSVLSGLIQTEVDRLRDDSVWGRSERQQDEERAALLGTSNWWDDVKTFVEEKGA